MPRILVTNDDGYQSPGLLGLVEALREIGEVTVFAPDHNWSAAGHTKTMHKPLRITEGSLPDGTPLYVTTGTPSDCVGLALLGIVPERPDLVLSGVNVGANLGQDVTYSGTVAGAMEAAIVGIPAMAVSQDPMNDGGESLRFGAHVSAVLARQVLAHGLPQYTLLNVNFPAIAPEQWQGIQVTRLGHRVYRDVLIRRLDPRGRPYYWIGGDPPLGEPEAGTDIGALSHGYVSVTPIAMDMTHREQLGALARWELSLPVYAKQVSSDL